VSVRGQCYCGAIVFEVTGAPSVVCLCHCSQCRRSVGATPVAWATFARSGWTLRQGTPRWLQSSAAARRGFCADCGSSLFFAGAATPDEIDVTVVSLEDADRLPPERHIWVPSKLPWARTDDGLPCHVADSGSPRMP
jgi:hypothetical protein